MNRTGKSLLLLAAFGIGFGANADTPDNRYDTIVDRNIFRLTSPPPPVVPTNADPAMERNIELSGISNIGGKKKAWFIVKAKGAKEPLYVSLSEGESQDSIEVSNISEEKGEVKVVNSGNPMILSFKNNAPKATASGVPPAPAAPGAVPRPVVSNAPTSPPNATSRYGGGSSVLVSGGAASPSPIQASQAGATAESNFRTIPTRALRLPSGVQQQSQEQSRQHQTPVNPQQQREMMEIQKLVYDSAGVPLPPLPPSTTVNSGGGGIPVPPTPGGYQGQ